MDDTEPIPICPTWRNGQIEAEGVAKTLDNFMLAEQFMDLMFMYRSWVDFGTISYHYPIILEFNSEGKRNHFSFKCNRS